MMGEISATISAFWTWFPVFVITVAWLPVTWLLVGFVSAIFVCFFVFIDGSILLNVSGLCFRKFHGFSSIQQLCQRVRRILERFCSQLVRTAGHFPVIIQSLYKWVRDGATPLVAILSKLGGALGFHPQAFLSWILSSALATCTSLTSLKSNFDPNLASRMALILLLLLMIVFFQAIHVITAYVRSYWR